MPRCSEASYKSLDVRENSVAMQGITPPSFDWYNALTASWDNTSEYGFQS